VTDAYKKDERGKAVSERLKKAGQGSDVDKNIIRNEGWLCGACLRCVIYDVSGLERGN